MPTPGTNALEQNIVLTGMPGVGKSTVGVLLAKAMARNFIDTDVHIQAREARSLRQILTEEGLAGFCAIEEQHVLELNCHGWVIATGGSVVYGEAAMRHLARDGIVVSLYLPVPDLERRVPDMRDRGVARQRGQDLDDLFRERDPLYRNYADTIVDCAGLDHGAVLARVRAAVTAHGDQGCQR